MKKLTLCILSFLLLYNFDNMAQQLPFNNQYQINKFSISPAYAGYNGNIETFAGYRRDWVGVPGAPVKAMMDINVPYDRKDVGFGLSLSNQETGNFEYFSALFSFAYHLEISRYSSLSFGIGAEFYRNQLDFSSVQSEPEIVDPFLANNQSLFGTTFDATIGVMFNANNFNAGLTVPRAIGMKVNYQKDIENQYSLSRHFRLFASYPIELSRDLELEPFGIVRMTMNSPLMFEASALLNYKERIWATLTYRKMTSFGLGVGGALNETLVMNYSYEFAVGNAILSHSSGTHEISIGYLIKDGKERKPTIFPKQKKKQESGGVDKKIIKKLKEDLEEEINKSSNDLDKEIKKLTTRVDELEKRLKEQDIATYGAPYILDNIQFGHNSDRLFASSYPELDKLAKKLKDNPNIEIKITGHTDNEGSPRYNLRLSQKRAEAVKKYLVSKGIDEARIVTDGVGEKKPIASNETRRGRAKNRRIEVQEKE